MSLFFRFLILSVCFLSARADAEDNTGLSYLGVCHSAWNCEDGIKAYEGQSSLKLSFLYDRTFGDDCPCIRKMYQDPRDKLTRIHLTNGPGLRNRRLQKEEVFYGYTISSAQQAILNDNESLKIKFQEVASRAASDYRQGSGINHLYVSTCLECNFSNSTRQKLIDWAKPFFPNAEFVDNPLWGACLPGLICEKHGDDPVVSPPCMVDLDGKDFESVDLKKFVTKYKSCLATFIWGYKFNLIDSRQPVFIPPRARKAYPDREYFKVLEGQGFLAR